MEPLDENLKELMKDLGAAINDTLSNSEKISEAIAKIRGAGYDVFLVLEATIGFNKREENAEYESEDGEGEAAESEAPVKRKFESTGKIKLTSQDQKFLKALKIAIDEEKS